MQDARDDLEEQLANLQALTDSTLNRLHVDALLVELLARTRDILAADTAAVLLLDEHSHELVATAACGIEEEVHQGVRIPLGSGFAGRIAATRQPLRLDLVDQTTVANPILWEKGIRVMLGVPLIIGDQLLGVLHVGRLEDRPFTADMSNFSKSSANASPARPKHSFSPSNTQPQPFWNGACSHGSSRSARDSSSPPGTHLQRAGRSAATGMTCSPCRPGDCGSLWAMSPDTV